MIIVASTREVDNLIEAHRGIKGQREEERVVLPGRGCMRYTIRGSLKPKEDGWMEGRVAKGMEGKRGEGRKD